MDDDLFFRNILLLGFVLVVPVAVYHRYQSITSEKLDRRQEGFALMIALRLLGIGAMFGLIAYMIEPAWMAWSSVPLPVEVRWAGVVLGALAGGLLIWTFRNLGKNLTDTVVTRKVHTLVTSGPYRWVRHPFYVAFALAVLANSLVTANWFIFVNSCIPVVLLAIRTRKEEANLVARFGDDYRRYMEQTGCFWPRWPAAPKSIS